MTGRLLPSFTASLLLACTMASTLATKGRARSLEEVKEAGEIEVCLQDEAPPFSNRVSNSGVFVELGQLIARDLGVKLKESWVISAEYVRKTTCDLLPAVGDLPSDDPIKRTKPYMMVRSVLVTKADAPPVNNLSDIGSGRVAVLAGSYARHDLTRRGVRLSVAFIENDEILAAVAEGRVFAGVVTRASFEHYVATHHVALRANDRPLAAAYDYAVSVGLRRADPELVTRVDAAVTAAARRGDLEAIFQKHGLTFSPVP